MDAVGPAAGIEGRQRAVALFADLAVPVIAAPMFLVTGPELVIAAASAGIVGVAASSSTRSPEEYDEWLERIDAGLAARRRDGAARIGPVAANVGAPSRQRGDTPRYVRDLEYCRKRRIPLVITVKGDPTEIVREVHGWGGLVFHDVTTIRHAEKAAEAGVDGLVLIGGGGGGHAGVLNPFAFLPQVRRFFSGAIVLGGAICDGRSVWAAQALGADVCYMGTRFIATKESMAPEAYKQMLVRARSNDIVYTPAFTRGVNCNFIRDSIVENGFDPTRLGEPAAGEPERLAQRKPWRDIWSAGQGVGLIHDVPSVAELVERLAQEYVSARAATAWR
ncbi:MAG: NAD(P)H-dependent flavin oxidoreductase [Reyranellaceae bacterium]